MTEEKLLVPALFLHIQKTAGTSIIHMAAGHYGLENICSHGDFSKKKPDEISNFSFISGHFGYNYALSLMRDRYSFTFLREPRERILSFYYFCRSQDPDLFPMYRIARENDLASFLRLGLEDRQMRSRIWNNQTWQLAHGYGYLVDAPATSELLELAKAHVQTFSYVGLTETFDEDATVIAGALGLPTHSEVAKANSSERPKAKELSDEESALLDQLTELDRELYAYVKAERPFKSAGEKPAEVRPVRGTPLREKIPALFMHIQKTAGTLVVSAARVQYDNSMVSHGDCWGRQPGELEGIKFVSGHVGYDYAKSLFRDRFSFTFLRDPVERILSMYYFCKGRDPSEFMIYERANKLDLEGFLAAGLTDEWVKKNIWNNQVWQLAHGYAHLDSRTINDFSERELLDLAMDHLQKFSFVGFTETADVDCSNIFAQLDMPWASALPKVNITEGKLLTQDLTSTARDLLEELTVLDRRLYDFAKSERSKNQMPG